MWLLLIVLLVMLVLGLPHWPYSRAAGFGYYPSTVALILLVIVLVLVLTGTAHWGFGPYPPP